MVHFYATMHLLFRQSIKLIEYWHIIDYEMEFMSDVREEPL